MLYASRMSRPLSVDTEDDIYICMRQYMIRCGPDEVILDITAGEDTPIISDSDDVSEL